MIIIVYDYITHSHVSYFIIIIKLVLMSVTILLQFVSNNIDLKNNTTTIESFFHLSCIALHCFVYQVNINTSTTK